MSALVVGLLLAACGAGDPPAVGAGPRSTPVASGTVDTVGEACPRLSAGHLQGSAGDVVAYVCPVASRPGSRGGLFDYAVVQRVTGGLDALLQAYGVEDHDRTAASCTTEAADPLVVWLHDSTRVVAVRAPWDVCSKPTKASRAAHAALRLVEVSATPTRQTRSQLSIDTGCPDTYKDVLAIDAGERPSSSTPPRPRPVRTGAEVCVYGVSAGTDDVPTGRLQKARRLTGPEIDVLNGGLARARVDATCVRTGHTRFAVVNDASTGAVVALDGCAVQQGNLTWRVGEEVRRLLQDGPG